MTVLGAVRGDGKGQRRASGLDFFFFKKHTCNVTFSLLVQQENTRHSKGCDFQKGIWGTNPRYGKSSQPFPLFAPTKTKTKTSLLILTLAAVWAWEGPGNNLAYEVCLGNDLAYAFRSVHGAGHVLCAQKGK